MYAAEVMITEKMMLIDNGGRRRIDDRRLYSYNGYLPERRCPARIADPVWTAEQNRDRSDRHVQRAEHALPSEDHFC
jgi:hypothetical protein